MKSAQTEKKKKKKKKKKGKRDLSSIHAFFFFFFPHFLVFNKVKSLSVCQISYSCFEEHIFFLKKRISFHCVLQKTRLKPV